MISIVMPTWQQGDHIAAAVCSIQDQTYREWEMTIVLDGPPDVGTEDFLSWGLKDLRIHEVQMKENGGTAQALNAGFDTARGDYFTWVSSDNIMRPTWLEEQLQYLLEHRDKDAVYSSYNHQLGTMKDGKWQVQRNLTIASEPVGLINSENCYIGPAFLYRRYLHDKVGEHRGKISHDYDWWLRAEEVGKIGFLDKVLCTYRAHNERVTITRRDQYDATYWQQQARERRSDAS